MQQQDKMGSMSNTERLTQEQISKVLDLHGKWLRGVPGGVRANLQGAHLENVNLYGANLRNANLQEANLYGANLEYAILQGANLENVDLRGASLENVNLQGANLENVNLQGANLEYAILQGANLENVDLRGAMLRGANLRRANLENVNLQGANLQGANLENVDLQGAKLPGPVIDLTGLTAGYKKVWNRDRSDQIVIELSFPPGTKLVSTVIGRKCRASEAVVVRCVSTGHKEETEFWSKYSGQFIYKVGETVKPVEAFDDSITVECTSGIHFFTTQAEAEAYWW